MERAVIEYAVNALWQLPLLAAGAWLLLRLVKPAPAAQHRVWLGVLGLALVLPLYGTVSRSASTASVPAQAIGAQAAQAANGFSPIAFDAVGQPGGLILGRATAATGPGTWALAFAARVHRVTLNATAARWIAGLYLAVVLGALFRLAWAWRGARRLLKNSHEIELDGAENAALEGCARRVGVKTPRVRVSNAITGPVVVGAAQPVLLWPGNFGPMAAGDSIGPHSEEEVTAALCHEMAHIRRRDYLMNLLCEAAAVPLRWHPVTHGVERRIRSTREMACDAMAAAAMESETKYATCLLSLAESMVMIDGVADAAGVSMAAGLFNGNALEERVMRLMQARTVMSARAKMLRSVAGAAVMAGTVGLAAMFHVVPALAQATTATQPVTAQSGVNGGVEGGVPGGVQGGVKGGVQGGVVAPAAPAQPASAAAPQPAVAPVTIADPAPEAAPLPAPTAPQATPEPAPKAAPAQAPKAAPEPAPTKAPQHDSWSSVDGKPVVWVDGERRELTPEERAQIEARLEEAQKRIAAETARINSPEFRKQIEDAAQVAKVNGPELQKQMARAQQQIAEAEARINSPEFRKQIEDAQKQACEAAQKISSAEIQKQMEEAQKQVAAATARVNSPEFRKQIEEAAQAGAKVNSAEIQKQMAEAQKQIADALAKMKAEDEAAQKK